MISSFMLAVFPDASANLPDEKFNVQCDLLLVVSVQIQNRV